MDKARARIASRSHPLGLAVAHTSNAAILIHFVQTEYERFVFIRPYAERARSLVLVAHSRVICAVLVKSDLDFLCRRVLHHKVGDKALFYLRREGATLECACARGLSFHLLVEFGVLQQKGLLLPIKSPNSTRFTL